MRTLQEIADMMDQITPPYPLPAPAECKPEWVASDTFHYGRTIGRLETLIWLDGQDGEVDLTVNEDFAAYVHRCGIETSPAYVEALENGLGGIQQAAGELRRLCLDQLAARGITSWSESEDHEIHFAVNGVEAILGYYAIANPIMPAGPRLCCIGVLVGSRLAQRAVIAESEQKVIRAINAVIDEARLFA